MKNVKMLMGVMCVCMMAMFFSGCGSTKLADSFDEETVKTSAETLIDLLNEGDYEGVIENFSQELSDAISPDRLEETMADALTAAGAFGEYKSVAVVGQKNQQTGEDNAVAVIVAEYENSKIVYTVSYAPDMKVNGFHFK